MDTLITPRRTAAAIPSPWPGLRVGITGGTSGLGRALARQLHAQGAEVALVARHADAVTTTAQALPGSHGITGDVSRKDDIHRIAMQLTGTLGGLDVLVNNASSLGPVPLALLADTECEDFELALQTNLLGPFRLTRVLLGALAASARAGRGGLVLNISSDAARTPYAGWGAYGASKAALEHMSRIWDQELQGSGVRVLSIDPGDMDTPLHAAAVPDADPSGLKAPAAAARELIAVLQAALPTATATATAHGGLPDGAGGSPAREGSPGKASGSRRDGARA
jgi:NAD(P)-dependent dehydrogenase (short-subunit alcohol dehydrogenase family)